MNKHKEKIKLVEKKNLKELIFKYRMNKLFDKAGNLKFLESK